VFNSSASFQRQKVSTKPWERWKILENLWAVVVSGEAERDLEDDWEEAAEILKENQKCFLHGWLTSSTQYFQLQVTHIYWIVNGHVPEENKHLEQYPWQRRMVSVDVWECEHMTETDKGERKCSTSTAGQWRHKAEHAEKWNGRESKLGEKRKEDEEGRSLWQVCHRRRKQH